MEPFQDDPAFCPFDGTALEKTKDRFLGRTIAARYRLIRRLGAGGMSVVYLARHELIDRLSAIKILRPELSVIAEHRERFLREARAVNRINHEHIVEITDVGEEGGVAYLVMEYVEGETLLAAVQRGRMAWPSALRIGIQIASALARAHQMGVIHRDLKPENVLLVSGPGAEAVAKLTDFGIAKLSGEPSLTLNEQLFGTPGYIAPEYVGGLPIDGRADIYSLAVVVYELVTGVLPFDGRGQSELLLKPLTSAPIPRSQRVEGLPPDLESLLLRALARAPNGRPHDAFAFHDEMVDVVRRFADRSSGALPPRAASLAPGAIEPAPRDALSTVMDAATAAAGGRSVTRNLGCGATTREMSSKWTGALAALETLIARAREKGGEHARVARNATEMALVAGEMVPRLERAGRLIGDLQAKVDLLEAKARETRGNLGHAIDVLLHDKSRERAHLDTLRARRMALERAISAAQMVMSSRDGASAAWARGPDSPSPASLADPRAWEVEALRLEEGRAAGVVTDLGFQIDALQRQLDAKNEELERDLVAATGSLEGALSAVRRLTSEVARTIDDGMEMLQRV
jgi:hypothetical protein